MYTNGLNHETHEIHEKKKQNHKWTRMYTNGLNHETHEIHERDPEPRMDTNVHEWVEPRNTRNTRKEKSEPRMDTNGHEYHLFIMRIQWLLEGCIDGCTPSLHPRLVLCHCRVVDVCPIWAGRGDGGTRLPYPHSKIEPFALPVPDFWG